MTKRTQCRFRGLDLVAGRLQVIVSALLLPLIAAAARADDLTVTAEGTRLTCTWPIENAESASIVFQLAADRPLIRSVSVGATPILTDVDPVLVMTVGSRNLSDKAGWIAFFDNPPRRPHEAHLATLRKRSEPRIEKVGARTTVTVADVTCGPFQGEMRFTFFPGSPLVQATAVMSTEKNGCAILYDAGLAGASPSWKNLAWIDNQTDELRRASPRLDSSAPLAVRHRTIVAEGGGDGGGGRVGSLAVFPPPHQYLYPLDFADNFQFVWHGSNWRDLVKQSGFGVRQTIEGDKRYVPWVNAPPGTKQNLSVFYLLTRADAAGAIEQVKRFTRGDTFKPLPGYKVFTSHYHVEHTLDFVRRQRRDGTNGIPAELREPGFDKTFKAHGIDIVHLAEFHVHHTPEMDARRLDLLRTMHEECARLSDESFLLLPGEEPNVHLGGHWISFFPRPVYWTLQREKGQPFVEQVQGLGNVYHVGSADDVLKLMQNERGLMWTAHPRIKGSFGFPDAYRKTPFFQSSRFLGAAWKAMPADYSHPRLGQRVLDLLDDMADWTGHKYVVGEVDVFKVEPDYELYGHMNVNYVRLDRLPRFSDGWQPLLDALEAGRCFVTTGEVLIPSLVQLDPTDQRSLHAEIEWTFPLEFAELIYSDGSTVGRQRVDLRDTRPFGRRKLQLPIPIEKPRWVRLEVWDIAGNGAFTQPHYFTLSRE